MLLKHINLILQLVKWWFILIIVINKKLSSKNIKLIFQKKYQLSKLVSISTLTGLSARYFGDINTPYWSTKELCANKIN